MWCDTPTSAPKYNISQDKDVSGMLKNCKESGNIDTIPNLKGVLVFMSGHVGVYVGNGEVIEARGHAYGVVKTKLNERPWTRWGKLNWIKYEVEEMFTSGNEALDYLVEKGRITDKNYWEIVLLTTRNVEYLLIKWANDVKALGE